jgi:hypothetical protein
LFTHAAKKVKRLCEHVGCGDERATFLENVLTFSNIIKIKF